MVKTKRCTKENKAELVSISYNCPKINKELRELYIPERVSINAYESECELCGSLERFLLLFLNACVAKLIL